MRYVRRMFLCLAVLVWSTTVSAQILTQTAPGLTNVRASAVAWGDVDNDGDLDLALAGLDATGQAITKIYNNNGAGTLTESQSLTGIIWGDLAWGDFDNDGQLDLAISGQGQDGDSAFGVSEVYRNIGSGQLALDPAQLQGPPPFFEVKLLRYGSVSWTDYTNDGKLDLVISGIDKNGFVATKLYTNQNNILTESSTQSVVAVRNGALSWGDFDGDGVPDLAVMGLDNSGLRTTKVYLNEDGILIESSSITLPPLFGGSLSWGDFDGDNNLDLAVSGWDVQWNAVLKIFRNNPLLGTLEEAFDLQVGGQGVVGRMAWGDYDNDGDQDLVISGRDEFTALTTSVFVNQGGASFTLANEPALEGQVNGNVAWGDVDGDARLDLLVTGEKNDGTLQTTIYTNSGAVNTAPNPPALTTPLVTSQGIEFRWAAGSDTETPVSSLTYNLRLGTTSGGSELVSTALTGPGNVGSTLIKRFDFPVSIDSLFWSVQTVDGSFLRSTFAAEDVIVVQRLVNSEQQLIGVRQNILGRGAAWGDYTGDGQIDLVIAGRDINGEAQTFLYRNDGGTLSRDERSSLNGLENGALAWGDYDNDGDLDLFRSGGDRFGNAFTYLYKNTGGVLSVDSSQVDILSGLNVTESNAAWADYNDDGRLDLAVNGKDRSGLFRTYIYQNTSPDYLLVRDTNQVLTGSVNGDLTWGDIDNDSDADLIITGQTTTGSALEVYKNTDGILTKDTAQNLPGFFSSAIALGDFDSDGDLDMAMNGGTGSPLMPTLNLYNNDGSGTFTLDQTFGGTFAGSVAWGDYDNDGDFDLMHTGQDINDQTISQIFRNDTGTLVQTQVAVLPGMVFSASPWADYDSDQDLDLILVGGVGDVRTETSQVFDNLTGQTDPNALPGSPTSLSAQSVNNTAILTWSDGSDSETPVNSLTYALRVGTAPGQNDIVSGINPVGMGNLGHTKSDTLRNLPDSTYYWSIKSIDAGLAASEEATEEMFTIDTTPPAVASVSVDPPIAGIGAVVTVVVNFDEKVGVDNTVDPSITFMPSQGGTALPIEQLSFSGPIWAGKVTISASVPKDTMMISVSGVQDLQGNIMVPVSDAGTFEVDTEIPAVLSTVPEADQVGASSSVIVKAVFSKALDPASVTNETFKMRRVDNGTSIDGVVTYDAATNSALFSPAARLLAETQYEMTATGNISDNVGNRLSADFRWTFTTATQVSIAQGGRLQSTTGNVSLYIPPNAVSQGSEEVSLEGVNGDSITVVAKRYVTEDDLQSINFVGPAFRFTPVTTTLQKPGTLAMKYVLPSGIDESKLAIFRENDSSPGSWARLGGTINATASTITTVIDQLGTFAVFEDPVGEGSNIPLASFGAAPRVLSPSGNRFNATEASISFTLGSAFPVTVEVYNIAGRLERVVCRDVMMGPGKMVEFWDGRDNDNKLCPSGLYIVIIDAGGNKDRTTISLLND